MASSGAAIKADYTIHNAPPLDTIIIPGGPLPESAPPKSAPERDRERNPTGVEAEIRAWARAHGVAVSERGRVAAAVRHAWEQRDPTDD